MFSLPNSVTPLYIIQFFSDFRNKITLANPIYQNQYSKNMGLLKVKYGKLLPQIISFDHPMIFMLSSQNPQNFWDEAYSFLCAVTFYEVNTAKNLLAFQNEDWLIIGGIFKYKSYKDLIKMKLELFRKNAVNYQWTIEEDTLLQNLIKDHQEKRQTKKYIAWLEIAKDFNQFSNVSQIRKASHLQERWKNTLKKKFKRGDWSEQDDLNILLFVQRFGSKWSKLSKLFTERTEHNLKNRFFSIMANYFSIPIKQVKKERKYLNTDALQNTVDLMRKI